jgi:hypothetical protein
MRSSISSSEARFFLGFLLVLAGLLGAWEWALRASGARETAPGLAELSYSRSLASGQEWLVFGNCLVMNGVSGARLGQIVSESSPPRIVNAAQHEQSPLAFFHYLRASGRYPPVIITNVSSWLNTTNFIKEGESMLAVDPLGLRAAGAEAPPAAQEGTSKPTASVQQRIEQTLTEQINAGLISLGKRYHLFDFGLFVWKLLTTLDLEASLYQLRIQSWYSVISAQADGAGFLGFEVEYQDSWTRGVDIMAEMQLQRMRQVNFLNDEYWQAFEDNIAHFRAHGSRILLVRMPEHPTIRTFNESRYRITERINAMSARHNLPYLDLSGLGPEQGVRLFDAVHPDAPSSQVITARIGEWVRRQPSIRQPQPSK